MPGDYACNVPSTAVLEIYIELPTLALVETAGPKTSCGAVELLGTGKNLPSPLAVENHSSWDRHQAPGMGSWGAIRRERYG